MASTKPLIVYVDDEPRNLAVFEASVPDDWQVKVFESAVEALKVVKSLNPAVILSDQRMPVMTGLEFLEVAAQLIPNTIRIIVTGQTEEQTIIQLVRRAKIFDYITKPWDTDDLIARLSSAVDFYNAVLEKNAAIDSLRAKNEELAKTNEELLKLSNIVKESTVREIALKEEIASWVPAPIVRALNEGEIKFPIKATIAGLAFDIVNSSALHNLEIRGLTVRSQIIKIFTEALMKHGGIRESQSGDSAYAHFGAFPSFQDPFVAAFSTAQEFRVALRSFSQLTGIQVECGIAVHLVEDAVIQLHELRVETPVGPLIQKSCVSESSHIDLLHRMEKLAHELPGSNVIMSKSFLDKLVAKPRNLTHLGFVTLKGQNNPVDLFMVKSDIVTKEEFESFLAKYFAGPKVEENAA